MDRAERRRRTKVKLRKFNEYRHRCNPGTCSWCSSNRLRRFRSTREGIVANQEDFNPTKRKIKLDKNR